MRHVEIRRLSRRKVLSQLPLFDGVGSPKFPKPSLPDTLIKNKNTLLACELLYSSYPSPRSLISPSSILLALRTYLPVQKIQFERTKVKHRLPIQYHYSEGHKSSLSLSHYCQLILVLFGGWVMDWERLDFRDWYGNGSDKLSRMGHN